MLDKIVKPYRVLSLDGGGMRGLYTASVLSTLSKRFGNNLDIGKGFDLLVGANTGSILAAGLVAGVPVDKIVSLYMTEGPRIFRNPVPKGIACKIIWMFRNLGKPANKNSDLRNVLSNVLGSETLGQVYKRRKIGLCIPSVNIATHRARVFKTAHNPIKNAVQ